MMKNSVKLHNISPIKHFPIVTAIDISCTTFTASSRVEFLMVIKSFQFNHIDDRSRTAILIKYFLFEYYEILNKIDEKVIRKHKSSIPTNILMTAQFFYGR